MKQGIEFDWVIAAFAPNSDQAKYILGLIEHGIGYHLLNKTRAKTENVIVGFKFIANRPLPQHLTKATEEQSRRLDSLESRRKERN